MTLPRLSDREALLRYLGEPDADARPSDCLDFALVTDEEVIAAIKSVPPHYTAPTLTIQAAPDSVGSRSLDLTAAAVAATSGGDTYQPTTGNELVFIDNGAGSNITVGFSINVLVDGVAVSSKKTFTVTAGHNVICGPFPLSIYGDANHFVDISYSAVTSVTVAVFQPF